MSYEMECQNSLVSPAVLCVCTFMWEYTVACFQCKSPIQVHHWACKPTKMFHIICTNLYRLEYISNRNRNKRWCFCISLLRTKSITTNILKWRRNLINRYKLNSNMEFHEFTALMTFYFFLQFCLITNWFIWCKTFVLNTYWSYVA